ncbi:MAG: GNAT family N-acetyltransferase [Pyrinomonadaceae bacterium]|nr:GNAT family N-acetyltransferase [Pyrinomonadaceae bacterium]
MVARLIKEALEAQGFSIETCHDGAAALKKIAGDAHYDVLLFDNELPGVQGLELIRRARGFAHRQHTPMLMLSASPYEVEALRAGADAFLLKPSDANSLIGVINRLLAHRLLGMPEIETARLRLRLFTANDLDDLTHLFGDPDVMRYLGVEAGQTHSRAETQPILDSIIGGWRRRGFGRWAVIHKESGQLIGVCGLRRLDGEIELVYMLAKEYWGRGYAREAARANLRFGFEELGLKRIVAITRRENVASQHVMQSIGMRYEREGRYYGVEAMCYAISRAEFAAGDAFYALTRLTPEPS